MGLLVLAAALVAPRLGAAADEAATGVVTISLKDGGTLVGTIVAEDQHAVRCEPLRGWS
jgi:hypothetical protein